VTGGIGVVALAAGLEGYWLRSATYFERALFVTAAFLLIDPHALTDVAGVALLVIALVMQKLRRADGIAAGAARAHS
jgi:TRAP-type uncharacterized transport system fused permease subunit